MVQQYSVVGKRLPRKDAIEKATGAAKYGADIKLPGMLTAKVLRSPYAHARVRKIDISRAAQLPGVAAIIVPDEMAKVFLSSFQNLPICPVGGGGSKSLADEDIFTSQPRFVGDAVAAVAAVNEAVAEEAIRLIDIDYELLTPVLDVDKAILPDSPRVHETVACNIPIHRVSPLNEGDVEKAFQEADVIVEDVFINSRQSQSPLENAVAVASYDGTGRLTVWVQSQMPHLARKQLAYRLDMPEGMVRLITPYVGGSFGLRNSMSPELIVALLSRKAGKPVKLEYTQNEDFGCYGPRAQLKNHLRLGFKKDGTLTAIQTQTLADTGAYISKTTTYVALFLGFTLEGPYRCANKSGVVDYVYTNHVRTAAYRGMGNDISTWAFEQMMDRAALKLGMDPVDLRLKNLKSIGDAGWAGRSLPIQSFALKECLESGAKKFGWKEKRRQKPSGAVRRGVGAAIMMHESGAQPFLVEHSCAMVKMHEDGSVSLITHPVECGQGTFGTLEQIVAEELGLTVEDVHIATGDTDFTLFDRGNYASGGTYIVGNSVLGAAREVKKQLIERASQSLGVPVDQLELKNKRVYSKSDPQKGISIATIANDTICNLQHQGFHIIGKHSFDPVTFSPPTQAAFVEVEVNTQTGAVKINRVVIANDCGVAINPMTVEGQLEGGLGQGIGYCLYENPTFDPATGAFTSDGFESYKIPSIFDVPEPEIIMVEQPDPVGPMGAKGAGEASMVTIAPAIANAIYHATGVQVTHLPISPEDILEGLKKNG